MIRRWKAMKKPQLCYLTQFFEIPYGLRAVLNIHNSVVLEFSFFLNFPLRICELIPDTYVNFFTEHQMNVLRHVFDLFDFFFLTCLIFVLGPFLYFPRHESEFLCET